MKDILDFHQSEVIRDNKVRAKTVWILLIGISIVDLLQIISECAEYSLAEKASREEISLSEAHWNDKRQLLFIYMHTIIYIVIIVFFIMWMRRAYHNLHKLKVPGLSASEGWAAGCWFVPIVNLYRPFQLMKEIWIKTVDVTGKVADLSYERTESALLGAWWAAWIITGVLGQIVFFVAKEQMHVSEVMNMDFLKIICHSTDICAAILLIIIVRRLSSFEQMLFEKQTEAAAIYEEDNAAHHVMPTINPL